MNSLRFAIIGCGKIAPRHAVETVKHGQLAAVCDIVKEKADALAQAYNCRTYYSMDDLLQKEDNKIDVVAVCTPNGLHAEHSIKALEWGCNVLCEKPLCVLHADGLKMIDAASKIKKKLFVVKSTRYNPALAALKQTINENKLGNIYSFQLNCFWNRTPSYYADSWKGNKLLDGGTLYTQFSHYIDALLWLLGDIKSVKGFRKNFAHKNIIDFEDSGAIAIEMENGTIGGLNWSVNTFKKNMEVSLSLIAEKGSIHIGGEYMNKIGYQLNDGFELKIPATGGANDYGFYKGSMSNHDKVYENLILALNDDNHPFTSAFDGLKTVEAIERIYKSVSLE
ncbi:MAG TPA: Gfo/Idh/MocA family oxidoreductase [Chitinophagaceae bacterium]|nr:Gfo/Idh/MocA family oxidoreductase [Chitinophagaceae bacterium]